MIFQVNKTTVSNTIGVNFSVGIRMHGILDSLNVLLVSMQFASMILMPSSQASQSNGKFWVIAYADFDHNFHHTCTIIFY